MKDRDILYLNSGSHHSQEEIVLQGQQDHKEKVGITCLFTTWANTLFVHTEFMY